MLYTQYPHLESFLDYLRFQKRYSPHTVIAYKKDLEDFFLFLQADFENIKLQNITAPLIRSWLAGLKEQDLTSKSIKRKISSLKSFFKFLMRENVLDATPMSTVLSPKISKRLPVYVEEKDMQVLFDHVEFPDTWNGKTERLILLLFYSTGLRVSELINLKIYNIDFAHSYIKVLGKGNKERIIPVQKRLLQEINSYINERTENANNGNVFVNAEGKPLYAKLVYNIVKNYLSKITTIQKKSPHVLRHSFATHLTNNGAELNAIKELLGHSSLAATQVYTHNSIEKLKTVFKKAHPKA